MKIVNFVKNNKYFLFGLLILVIVIIINCFPADYVFGGGDTNQLILAKDSFYRFFFRLEGRAIFFYGIFYVLSLFGVSESAQLSVYLGFVIFGSFLSFWFFAKFLFAKSTDLQKSLGALFYALNLYTLFLFTGNWGYSYFPSLYVFIPVLLGLLIRLLQSQKLIYGLWFCLVMFLGSSGFGNPAFALSFALLCIFLIFFLTLTGYVKFSQDLLVKLFLVGLLAVLVNVFWIAPLIPQMLGGVENLATSNTVNFDSWIRSTSSPLSYIFSLRHFSDMHFPQNFYYKDWNFLKSFFVALSFAHMIVIVWGLTHLQEMKKDKRILYLALLGLFLVFAMLVAKVRFPFETINQWIYHIWGFEVLRGYDKTAIYIPFLFSVLLMLGFSWNKKIIYIGLALALLAPLPFYVGKLQQTAGYRVSSKKDFTTAKMSFLTKIPQEYYGIQDILSSDKNNSKIATLPSTYSDGSGVTYYPKWEFYGADITQYLYGRVFVEANAAAFPGWSYADDFNDVNLDDNSWVIKLLGMMNVKYIIYHKDAPEDTVGKTLYKIKKLEKDGFIQRLEENNFFILYAIHKDYFIPYITWQKEDIKVVGRVNSISRSFEKIHAAFADVEFWQINPKKFVIDLKNQRLGEELVLSETFSPLWKAYVIDANGKETEIQNHFKARGYANGWRIEDSDNIFKIVIEYYPIRLMWRGMIVSFVIFVLLLIYLIHYYYAKRKLA